MSSHKIATRAGTVQGVVAGAQDRGNVADQRAETAHQGHSRRGYARPRRQGCVSYLHTLAPSYLYSTLYDDQIHKVSVVV